MALIYYIDAMNATSYPYGDSVPPGPIASGLTDISGWMPQPGATNWASSPELTNPVARETDSLGVKAIRMRAVVGGTYNSLASIADNTGVGTNLGLSTGGSPPYPYDLGYYVQPPNSHTHALWLKFNKQPVPGGPGTGGTDMPTTVWSTPSNNSARFVFCCALGDTDRTSNAMAINYYAGQYSGPGGTSLGPTRGVNYLVAGNWVPSVGVWYYVSMVFQRTGATTGTAYLYINGVLNGSESISLNAGVNGGQGPWWLGDPGSFVGTFTINKGYYPNSIPSAPNFGGDISLKSYKIWNTALTPAEITTDFTLDKTIFGYTDPPPIYVPPASDRDWGFLEFPKRPPSSKWSARSRGNRWIVSIRDDYRIEGAVISGTVLIPLVDVPLGNSVINAAEFGGFYIGDSAATFEFLGYATNTLAAATSTASGTIT